MHANVMEIQRHVRSSCGKFLETQPLTIHNLPAVLPAIEKVVRLTNLSNQGTHLEIELARNQGAGTTPQAPLASASEEIATCSPTRCGPARCAADLLLAHYSWLWRPIRIVSRHASYRSRHEDRACRRRFGELLPTRNSRDDSLRQDRSGRQREEARGDLLAAIERWHQQGIHSPA